MTVKICDFGLSRYQRESTEAHYTHVGTAAWAAPEMIRHDEYTEKADVYLGRNVQLPKPTRNSDELKAG